MPLSARASDHPQRARCCRMRMQVAGDQPQEAWVDGTDHDAEGHPSGQQPSHEDSKEP